MQLRQLSILTAALAIAPLSRATAVPFSTGFEASDGYATGRLAGQNGWIASAATTVESAVFHSGARAASFTSQSGQLITFQPVNYNSAGNPSQLLVFDLQFMMPNPGSMPIWEVLSVDGNIGFLGQLLVDPTGHAMLGLASSAVGSVALTPNAWHEFQLVLDFQHQTLTAYVDSILIGSGPFASGSTQVIAMGIGQNGGSGVNQTAYWDDLSVSVSSPSVTPVPPTFLLTLTVLGFIGLYGARRKFDWSHR